MENDYVIIADRSCDLSSELMSRFNVDERMKGYMNTPDADDVECSYSMSETEIDAFYSSLKSNKNKYSTSSPSIDDSVSCFEPFLQQGRDIIVICLSGALSSTYNVLLCAQKIVIEKYPERKVFVIDSQRYSTGIGLLVIKACQLRADGCSIGENAQKLEKIKTTIHQMGTVDDLFWVASKGRISNSKAFFGTIAGIKSLGDFSSEGMVTLMAKISGYKKANKAVIEYIRKTIKYAHEQIIFVAHSARRAQAGILASLVKENIKPKEVIISEIYPMSGINVGPGLIAVLYFGTEITDLNYEKKVMNEIISSKL